MLFRINILIALISILIVSCVAQEKRQKAYQPEQRRFTIDTSFISKASVESICPCKTTLSDIMKTGTLQAVQVEDMDKGKNCIGSDARFENGKGFSLGTTKGIIVQKDESTEYVAKIHLTKDFEGRLPNGQFISVKNLKVKDVIKMYPDMGFGTRDCSDYWNYNNDTVNFYFRVDKAIRRYPINMDYYAGKPIEGIDIVLWCYKMYSPDYSGEVVYERPLYAPLSETHVNAYVLKERDGIGTRIRNVLSFGKKTNYDIIRLGKWLEYSPEHQLVAEAYYDNKGNLIKKLQ